MACNNHSYDPVVDPRFELGKWYQIIEPNENDPMYGSQINWSPVLDDTVGNIYQVHSVFYGGKHGFLTGIKGNVAVHINWTKGPYDSRKEAELAKKIKWNKKSTDNDLMDKAYKLSEEFGKEFLNNWERGFVSSIHSDWYDCAISDKQRNMLNKIVAKLPEQIEVLALDAPDYDTMEDIKYFRNKMADALKIPKEFLNDQNQKSLDAVTKNCNMIEDSKKVYEMVKVEEIAEGETLAFDGQGWIGGSPTTSRPVKVRGRDGLPVSLPGGIEVKGRNWQKKTKGIVDGSFDYQKHAGDNGTPYVQGELCGMKEISECDGKKVLVTEWKDPSTGMVSSFEQVVNEPGYIEIDQSDYGYNPCNEIALDMDTDDLDIDMGGERIWGRAAKIDGGAVTITGGAGGSTGSGGKLDIRFNPLADDEDISFPVREKSMKRKIQDVEHDYRNKVYKVKADGNLRDQKRDMRRERDNEPLQALPVKRSRRWGWIAAAVLAVSGIIAGAWYTDSLPDVSGAQDYVVQQYHDLVGR